MRFKALLVFASFLALGSTAQAQDVAGGGDLAAFIPTFFGPEGITLQSGIPHFAHFEGQTLNNIGAFNTAFASQLTSLPLPSPASGFTYSYDSKTGVFVITTSAVSSEQQVVITTQYQNSTQSATFYIEP